MKTYYFLGLKRLKNWLTSKRFSIYLVCVFVAGLVWLLIKFSRDYNSQFPVTVKMEAPDGSAYILLSESSEAQAEIFGFGFDLFSFRLFGFKPIEISTSDYQMVGDSNLTYIKVPGSDLSKRINDQLGGNAQVLNIYPSELTFYLSPAITRKIAIKNNITTIPQNGFKIKGVPSISPDSLTFFGPKSVLNAIAFIPTLSDTLRDLSASQTLPLTLQLDTLTTYLQNSSTPNLSIVVDELTTGRIDVPVTLPAGAPSMRVLPSKVSVVYQVGLTDFSNVNEQMFNATFRLPEKDNFPDKLKVQLIQHPDFVSVQRIEPLFVEYLLLEKTPQ